jgi:hypothetical protein
MGGTYLDSYNMSPLQKGQSHREEAKRAKIFKKLKENLQDFSRKPSKS